MPGSKREIYESGRADERSEILAWLRERAERARSLAGRGLDLSLDQIITLIAEGAHAEVEVAGDVGRD